MRDKEETKRQITKLLLEKKEKEHQIKKLVWDYMNLKKEMPDSFPYKKWIREELGLVV